MPDASAIAFLSATQIQQMRAVGTLSLKQVTTALQQHIHATNPAINAFDCLLQEFQPAAPGPLHGLPISIKDQIHVAGLSCSFGLDKPPTAPCTNTASAVQHLLNAGASIIGKTNLPPLAMDYQSFNARSGRTNNPWNVSFTAGGSSGGGAAAVAAGLSYLDIGADLAGSLRIPAAFCGVFSLLPTEGRLASDGMLPQPTSLAHFARLGPIARHVEDLQLAWEHLGGDSAAADLTSPPQIGCWQPLADDIIDPLIQHQFAATRQTLNSAGIPLRAVTETEVFRPGMHRCFGEIMGYETGQLMPALPRWLGRMAGRSAAKRSPAFLSHVHSGQALNRGRYHSALAQRRQFQNQFDHSFGDVDALLLPVSRIACFEHRQPTVERNGIRDYQAPFIIEGRSISYLDALTTFVTPISLIGNPVVTLPLGVDRRGLPVGAQLVGQRGKDAELLKVAAYLTQYLPRVTLAPGAD